MKQKDNRQARACVDRLMNVQTIHLDDDTRVLMFRGQTNSHLVVRGPRSLLVDCGDAALPGALVSVGLPRPDMVLHTHVQEEHCREGNAWPDARVLVPLGTVELASDPQGFARKANTTWTNPSAWPTTMGQEPYGIGGAITTRPPAKRLTVRARLRAFLERLH